MSSNLIWRTLIFIVSVLFNIRSIFTPCRMGQCVCHFYSSKLEIILFLRLNCPKAKRPKEQKFVTHISSPFWLFLFYFLCFNVSHFSHAPTLWLLKFKSKVSHMCQGKPKSVLMLIVGRKFCTVWVQSVNKFIALNTGTRCNTEYICLPNLQNTSI